MTCVALVTGGSRGIGAAIVRRLAEEGYDIAFNHLGDAAGVRETAAVVGRLGRRCFVRETDVARFAEAEAMVAATLEELGRLDVCVCNAGTTADRVVWKMAEEEWDRVLAVNLKGVFGYVRAAGRRFREQRGGRIVVVASINGLRGKFGQANYAASKGGAIALAKTAARELGRYGVTVNAVAPGMVRTELTRTLPDELVARAVEESALGRIAEPDDVAALVAFLCSKGARAITGQCISVDAGQYI